jgi:FRG domain
LRRNTSSKSPLVFRGHGSENWKLETTLERSWHPQKVSEYYRLILRIKSEIESLADLAWPKGPTWPEVDKLVKDYEPFALRLGDLPHYEYMTYLRHHGFPTPLLDWSRSPFVAAYFAFSRPLTENVVIFAFCDAPQGFKVSGNDDAQIVTCGPYVSTHKRHFAQQSQYTICLKHHENGWHFKPHSNVFEQEVAGQDRLYKFRMKNSERAAVLRELLDYNLTAFSLLGSQESLMETISVREELAGAKFRMGEAGK